jgi:L-ascorbate metabolism protein UlaG (beta-lactamase superfamily)
MSVQLTLIGGPTALLEIGPFRLLTDPVFDPPGAHYSFGLGTGSDKTTGPAIPAAELGRIDAVLLSHDHHADNLDPAGRAVLPEAEQVLTTTAGAKRLGGNAVGLEPWASVELEHEGARLTVTATPARHGPPLSRPLVGHVIGFVLEGDDLDGPLYISGDTVMYGGVEEVARRFDVDVAVLHLGGAAFTITGPARYTMTARSALKAIDALKPRLVVPVHFEGWTHFTDDEETARAELANATAPVRWPARGETLQL